MFWAKFNQSTRSLLFTAAVLGTTSAGLWLGAGFNTAEASTSDKAVTAPAATFPANAATLGAIPDRGVTGCSDTDPATSKDVTFTVSGITGAPSQVQVTGLTFGSPVHTWVGDVKALLIAPNGTSFPIFGRTGETLATGCGDSTDLGGPYDFADSAAAPPNGGWWQTATTLGSAVPMTTGAYRTTALGGAGGVNPSPATNLTAAFSGVTSPNGTWTLRLTDHGGGDTGGVTAANLVLNGGTAVTPKANADFSGDGRTDYTVARAITTNLTQATEDSDQAAGKTNGGVYSVRERMALNRANAKAGDNQADLAGPRLAWYTSNVANGTVTNSIFGDSATDTVVPEDYDGDGKKDIAVWRSGAPFTAAFYILQSSNNTVRTDIFGQAGDDPAITGDYDGDGKADTATYRCPAFGTAAGQCYFYYRPSSTGNTTPGGINVVPWGFGNDGDFYVNPGDYDGDGKYDFCIQRANPSAPATSQFLLFKSNGSGVEYINWGLASDFILPGDYDGDGKSDFCVRRTVNNARQHYILERDGGGTGANPIVFGITGDVSVPGDYDGDGKQDVAVWRPSTNDAQNFFYVLRSSDGALQQFEWGQCASGDCDYPVANWYVH